MHMVACIRQAPLVKIYDPTASQILEMIRLSSSSVDLSRLIPGDLRPLLSVGTSIKHELSKGKVQGQEGADLVLETELSSGHV